jgi:hypothetical protein
MVYEPTIGLARKLQVDFQTYIEDLRHVYDLYPVTSDNIRNGARYAGDPRVQEESTYMHDIEEATKEEFE